MSFHEATEEKDSSLGEIRTTLPADGELEGFQHLVCTHTVYPVLFFDCPMETAAH